ncbi:MAG: hypothetical protein V1880_04230 [Patescibacteria group bacterium]
MANIIATIILLAISIFVINLFPMGKEFLGSIMDSFHEKKTNVMEEYERVKAEVDDINKTVTETKSKVEKTVETVGNAVDTAANALDKVNSFLGNDEKDDGKLTEETTKENPEEE